MKIRIHYSFVIYIFILFFLNLLKYYSVFFISILLHEMTHAIIGILYGIKISNIEISMSGVSIRFKEMDITYFKKIIIYISGPLINILLAILAYFCHKEKYIFFIFSNCVLFIFNIIPIYPLDGGKILYEILINKFYLNNLIIERLFSVFQIILLFVLAYLCINYSNIQLFFLGIYFLKFTCSYMY